MKLTNHSKLPETIVRAIENDPYSSEGSDISVTRLIAPPRVRVLEQRHWDELEEDVSDKIFTLIGSSVHHVIERAVSENDISERRLFVDIYDWTLSGQFDLLTESGDLIDFKVTSAWSALEAMEKGKSDWERQLNVLDWLIRNNDQELRNNKGKELEVKSMYIMAILRDWSKMKVMTSDNYPRKQVIMIPINRWTPQEQDKYVEDRIKLHQLAEQQGDDLMVCTPEERWRKETTYAVMKKNRRTAARVLPSRKEAMKWIEDNHLKYNVNATVIERKGQDVKCANYCRVNKFCSYYQDTAF